ncbi:unnamed protein product [Choristocarpus tenellus]
MQCYRAGNVRRLFKVYLRGYGRDAGILCCQYLICPSMTRVRHGSRRMGGGSHCGMGNASLSTRKNLKTDVNSKRAPSHEEIVQSRCGGGKQQEKPVQGNSQTVNKDEVVGFKQLAAMMKIIQSFIDGGKLLWRDFGLMRDAQQRKEKGEILSRAEERLIREVPRDIARVLPLAILFAIPIIGNMLPILGARYPKALLSSQFWTRPQHSDFMAQDMQLQEAIFFPAVQCLIYHHVSSLTQQANQTLPSADSRMKKRPLAWSLLRSGEIGGVVLKNLSLQHLEQLAMSCNPMPPAKKAVVRLVPKAMLVAWLEKEAEHIGQNDLQLLRHLGDTRDNFTGSPTSSRAEQLCEVLSKEEVVLLCWERGLLSTSAVAPAESKGEDAQNDIGDYQSSVLCSRLSTWLALYDQDEPVLLSASLILHAPALLSSESNKN